MFTTALIATAIATSAILLPQTAHASIIKAPHEKTYTAPGGLTFTVGHMNESADPVAPINFMPTDREVFLNDTAYARINGPAGGKLKTGFVVGCAVNVDLSVGLKAGANLDLSAPIGISASPASVLPSLNVTLTPDIGLGANIAADITPGKIQAIEVDSKDIGPGQTAYIDVHDFDIRVPNCAGPLTIRSYTTVAVTSPQVDTAASVSGDPIVL